MKGFPSTRRAQLGGAAFEFVLEGSGEPTLVLLNGAGGPVEAWWRIFPDLVRTSRVFAHNRPGIGGSDPPQRPQTSAAVIADTQALLLHACVSGPLVLVGHSFGALHALKWASDAPEQVVGLVLIEGATAGDILEADAHKPGWTKGLEWALRRLTGSDPLSETAHARDIAKEVGDIHPLTIPIAVITGARGGGWMTPRSFREGRAARQAELARLSPDGWQVTAQRSGHFPQITEPALVTDVIGQVFERAAPRGGAA